jgi:protein gp37
MRFEWQTGSREPKISWPGRKWELDRPGELVAVRDLEKPIRWKKPRRIFVNSMGDLFHQSIDIDGPVYNSIMRMVRKCPQHKFLFLTKRPGKMQWVCERIWQNDLPRNTWLGVTAENQKRADERVPILLQIPAAVRFVSVEPMLGEIDFDRYLPDKPLCAPYLDW